MVTFIRANAEHSGFIELVKLLDAYLSVVDGADHTFYDQFNSIEKLKYVVVAYEEDLIVGCGAIKEFDSTSMEVKRMFVQPSFRGRGLAKKILKELEQWASELGFRKCILETGKRMQDAVSLYESCGYLSIPNYGPYIEMDNSVCFEKVISFN